MLVHAHPDDECISTGGTIARYSDEGAHVCLITCTNGEEGEVADLPELGDAADVKARLGEVRADELREACDRLGRVDLRMLGYRDSGMEGTPANADPAVFINQDLEEVAGRITRIIREVRPQALVTYNEIGAYGHPDHIRAHQAAMRAVEAAADPAFAPEAGPPHRVAKMYYTAFPRSFIGAARELAEQIGIDREEFITDEEAERIATDDDAITTAIDVTAYVARKFDALAAHRTQLGTTRWMFEMPDDVRPWAMGTEHFVLAPSGVPGSEGREQDLFAGLGL